MNEQLMKAAFPLFRVPTAASMVRSAILVKVVVGGLLRRALRQSLGAGTWTSMAPMSSGVTTIRRMGFLFVAFGIFDNLSI